MVYILRTDIDPSGYEKNYIKYINSNITKKDYDEVLKKYKTKLS
jgi:homospermidine synthase